MVPTPQGTSHDPSHRAALVTAARGDTDPMEPTPETTMASEFTEPTSPARPLSDPRKLLTGRPMPKREYNLLLPDGTVERVLLQGLTSLEKNTLDGWTAAEAMDDQQNGTTRPSMLHARMIVAALRTPTGQKVYQEEVEIRAAAVAFAEQFQAGVMYRAAGAVSELSGYGLDAEKLAGNG